jgi:hypothetical protein
MLSRRQFARVLSGVLVLGWAGGTAAHAADGRPAASLEGPLTLEVFRALVGEEFSVLLSNRAATLVLVRVDDAGRPNSGQFVAVFEGGRDLALGDGTYRVTHATAGTTMLYLRPGGSHDGHSLYEAPFNVLPDNASVPNSAPVRQMRRFEQPLYTPRP